MKKLMTLLLAAGLVFSAANKAAAIEWKPFGQADFVGEVLNNFGDGVEWGAYAFQDNGDVKHNYNPNNSTGQFYHQKHSRVIQRFILGTDIVASESLSGHIDFLAGVFTWGGPSADAKPFAGGTLGGRGINLVTRQAYLDWVVPNTQVKVRMGLQAMSIPTFATGTLNPFADEFGTGIQVNVPINKAVSISAGWVRAGSESRRANGASLASHTDDNTDVFTLLVPVKLDGIKFTPWGAFAFVGENAWATTNQWSSGITSKREIRMTPLMLAMQSATNNGGALPGAAGIPGERFDNSRAWWLGVGGELVKFDPFRFAIDVAYSALDTEHRYSDRSGWLVGASAEYKTRYGVPTLKGWYASGDDSNINNGSERGISAGSYSKTGVLSFMGGNSTTNLIDTQAAGMPGTWGLSLQWNRLSLIDKLFHNFRVSYVQGTNASPMARYYGMGKGAGGMAQAGVANGAVRFVQDYMTNKDSIIELDFETVYSIYANLAVGLEVGYIFENFSGKTWAAGLNAPGTPASLRTAGVTSFNFSNAWRISTVLRYTF